MSATSPTHVSRASTRRFSLLDQIVQPSEQEKHSLGILFFREPLEQFRPLRLDRVQHSVYNLLSYNRVRFG